MVAKTVEIQVSEPDLQALLALVREGVDVRLMEGDQPVARVGVEIALAPVKRERILGLHAHWGIVKQHQQKPIIIASHLIVCWLHRRKTTP